MSEGQTFVDPAAAPTVDYIEGAGEIGNEWGEPEIPQEFLDNCTPLKWHVLVLPVLPPEVSSGGIILPDSTKDANKYLNYLGKVVMIGDLVWKHPRYKDMGQDPDNPPVKAGDYILYARHVPCRIAWRHLDLVLVNDDEILMKIESPKGFRVYTGI